MCGRQPFSRVTLWILLAALGWPPAPAFAAAPPDKWSRVLALTADTRVIVTLDIGTVVDGWLVSAREDGLTVDVRGGLYVEIARDRVSQVAIVRDRRPWYAIPITAAAVVGGLAITIATLWGCRGGGCDDSDGSWFLVALAMPFLAGAWAYSKFEPRQSVKVIYEAPRKAA